jgi:hypothetical protein
LLALSIGCALLSMTSLDSVVGEAHRALASLSFRKTAGAPEGCRKSGRR